jgi:16S rRNA (adenine1518-N6/adenine1519-N6)-dimethyltransferase
MKAKKSLGQHFLTSPYYLGRIADYCIPVHPETLIEIGPGSGNLTRTLLNKGVSSLKSIEIDIRSIEYLDTIKALYPNFDYIIADASEYQYSPGQYVCGNLPYNIGTKILLSCCRHKVKTMVFLLQAEVVDKVVAKHNTSDYSGLSVLVQTYYTTKSVLNVPPEAFSPRPKVKSKLLVCNIKENIDIEYDDLSKLLRKAFQFPRKTLQNNLGKDISSQITPEWLNRRPGNLSIEEYLELLGMVGGF